MSNTYSSRADNLCGCLVLLLAAAASAATFTLPSGLAVTWSSTFPHNELKASVILPDGYVALTASGHLLRFDSRFRLQAERAYSPGIATLEEGGSDSRIRAATRDGRVLKIDPADLSGVEIGKDLPVRGVGRRSGRARFLDGRQLWTGDDHGEWGGSLSRVELDTGKPPVTRKTDAGIYGIGKLSDGRVIVWGGTQHMGLTAAVIEEAATARRLYAGKSFEGRGVGAGPHMPITHIVPDGPATLAVFAYDGVFRTDAAFQNWTRMGRLDLNYPRGRPDAVGAYPALVAVHRTGPGRFVCATRLDGYLELDQGRCIPHPIPTDAPIRGIGRIERASRGLLFLPGDEDEPSWWLSHGRWEQAVLDPPVAGSHPNGEWGAPPPLPAELPDHWDSRRVIAAQGGVLITASQMDNTVCLPVLTRWHGARPEVLARAVYRPTEGAERTGGAVATIDFSGESLFWTPDGAIWSAAGRLERLDGGSWQRYPRADGAVTRTLHFRSGLRVVNASGPPWFLLSEDQLDPLWRLDYSSGFRGAHLDAVREDIIVQDAVALGADQIVVVTREGLVQRFTPTTSTYAPLAGPASRGKIAHVTRDDTGRLWLGGDSVWVQNSRRDGWEDLSRLPILTGKVTALAPDPDHADGVVAVTRDNELAFIRAQANP